MTSHLQFNPMLIDFSQKTYREIFTLYIIITKIEKTTNLVLILKQKKTMVVTHSDTYINK